MVGRGDDRERLEADVGGLLDGDRVGDVLALDEGPDRAAAGGDGRGGGGRGMGDIDEVRVREGGRAEAAAAAAAAIDCLIEGRFVEGRPIDAARRGRR